VTDARLREDICRLGASIYERGLTHGSTGNISARCEGGWLLTPTGSSFGRLDPERLSMMDWKGAVVSGDAPSKEAFLHLAMYEAREKNAAVIHLHSTHSVAVSLLEDVNPADVLPPLTAYYVMRVGSLPLVPYFAPGDMALAQAVRGFAGRHHAVLLANHGPVVAGSSLSAAADAVEELEATAKLYLMLRHAKVRCLTDAQVAELRRQYPA
jgi:ribulose-5-phosphate 4-epimerase/fuculose-1-phosphate aldolase